jgi:sugar phosphate isomerase/epimerase
MRVAKKLGGRMIVSSGKGPRDLSGPQLKAAVADFLEQMKPHLAVAEETGVTIAIENHGNNLIDSPDSIKWMAELARSPNIGIALAPYHLPQDPAQIASLIGTLGERMVLFYAWEHGKGSTEKMPKADELQQMPGRGELDFAPIVAALVKSRFTGWTSIFMHPFPRGIAIHETTAEVTAEVNRARTHLEALAA